MKPCSISWCCAMSRSESGGGCAVHASYPSHTKPPVSIVLVHEFNKSLHRQGLLDTRDYGGGYARVE